MEKKSILEVATAVGADKQLKNDEYVMISGDENAEKKILFLGNSITRHGVNESVAWYGDFGMAASSIDNDYVHLVDKMVNEKVKASFCISQVSSWAQHYKEGDKHLERFRLAREYNADIIIVKFAANAPVENFDAEIFEKQFNTLMEFHNPGNAQIILCSEFYHHPANDIFKKWAEVRKIPYVSLEDLCDNESMLALGRFEHKGVAGHPGDRGMAAIADRIWAVLKYMI